MSELTNKLRAGCINYPKRYSGDNRQDLGGIVDEVSSDELMSHAADEIDRLDKALIEANLWHPVTETLPPDTFRVWLAVSDGRVMLGQANHKSADAKYDATVHDWFVDDQEDGSKSIRCLGDNLSIVAWMQFTAPEHPQTFAREDGMVVKALSSSKIFKGQL